MRKLFRAVMMLKCPVCGSENIAMQSIPYVGVQCTCRNCGDQWTNTGR